jgi:hypothetical protein
MEANQPIQTLETAFYPGSLNRFVGSGGEVLLKEDPKAPPGRMDVGDRLIGIGITHLIENMDTPPGPESFRSSKEEDRPMKVAARSFRVTSKVAGEAGHDFRFEPLPPEEYSEALAEVSEGAVAISPDSIPPGTIILSFIDAEGAYTLRTLADSPGANWVAATSGSRHWNVGFAGETDFWSASFPSDEISLLRELPPTVEVGSIRFGLSLLPESRTTVELEQVACLHPSGETTMHHFCLEGRAAGTKDLDTPFPIGLRTAITFRPRG